MNRWLQRINLFGVLVVTVICVVQWQANRRLNLEINQLEKLHIEKSGALEEQSKEAKGYLEDLENFRIDLTRTKENLKEQTNKNLAAETLAQRLAAEQEQLKTSLTNWVNAVTERDAQLKESNDLIRKQSADLNAAIKKFNDLATNYNTVVKDLNDLRTNTVPSNKENNAK